MGSEDEAELGHENDLFGTPGREDPLPVLSPRRERLPPAGIVPFTQPSVAKMAAVEGLDAHRRAVTLRLGMGLDE